MTLYVYYPSGSCINDLLFHFQSQLCQFCSGFAVTEGVEAGYLMHVQDATRCPEPELSLTPVSFCHHVEAIGAGFVVRIFAERCALLVHISGSTPGLVLRLFAPQAIKHHFLEREY